VCSVELQYPALAHGVRIRGHRERLVAAQLEAARTRAPRVDLPKEFAHYRFDLGTELYGLMEVAHDDVEARRVAILRNWEFLRAPLAGIVCINRELGAEDILSVGMFLQTLILALTARGLGTCVQVSIAGYPDVVRAQLDIPEEFTILCGLAVGYPDPEFRANQIRTPRDAPESKVIFLD
jgi:nitroreductase